MNFYLCIIVLTELMMIAMTFHVLHYTGFTRIQRFWFLLTFVSIMLCAAAEFTVHFGSYNPSFAPLLTVITVFQFSVAPILGVFFSGALGLHHQAKIASLIFSLNFLIEIAAAPSGRIFYFNEAGYFRGDYFWIYETFYFFSLLYLLVSMVIVGRNFRHRDVWTICMILVILMAGILPMTLFHINITYIAIAISASLCYIYYNDLVQADIQTELVANQKKISDMQEHMISGLASLIESRDMETGGHIARTSDYVKALAEAARGDQVYAGELDEHYISLLYTLAPMHDIGKIVVPDQILKKPGRLTREEFEEMKRHAAAGGTIVRDVLSGVTDKEYLSIASDIASFHHEWWDGTGYPSGLKGEEIPLSARIMAIADVYDALISERCYKKPISKAAACRIIREESGTHFDPQLVEVFLRHQELFQ